MATPPGDAPQADSGIGFFDRFLTVWVLACMAVGVVIGRVWPSVPQALNRVTYANLSIPIAVLIWVMIYPMMLKVELASLRGVRANPGGLLVTWVANWLVKPFTMFALTSLFFYVVFSGLISADLARDYVAGAVILGAAPCTAMVFVWSHLTRGNPAYTVVQVATNDLLILVLFTPIVGLLLGIGGIRIPWATLLASVGLFVVIPLAAGALTRAFLTRRRGLAYLEQTFIPRFGRVTIAGLLATLVLIFASQSAVIVANPAHIALIAVPLVIQTVLLFSLTYGAARLLRLRHDIAAPAAMIGGSNFFELAVAVAVAIFGATSPVALATTVGVLVEVPVMLGLVWVANRTAGWFPVDVPARPPV